MTVDYLRQLDIFNPIKQKYRIVVLGAGSLGSFITLNLAKLGFNNIEVWDYDKVDDINIPNQFYRLKDVGKFKVDALKELVKEFTDIDIKIKNEELTKKTKLYLDLNNIYILTFDTLKARRLVFEILKDVSCKVLDIRAGGEEFNIQVINTMRYDNIKKWDDSFNITPTDLPCSAKSIIYTNLIIAGEVCNLVKKINNDDKYPTKLIRHTQGYDIINNFKNSKQETI